jgi:hypothetical protein
MYMTPRTTSGVPLKPAALSGISGYGGNVGSSATSGDRHVQATFSALKLSRVIWSSGEYF